MLNYRVYWLALVFLAATVGLQQQRFTAHPNKPTTDLSTAEQNLSFEKANLAALTTLPTLGFDNLIADWAFLRFLQYFGDDKSRQVTGYGLSPDFFALIIEHDPHFTHTYSYMFASVSLYLGQPATTIAFTEKALASLTPTTPPDSHILWRNKGIEEFLFFGDVRGAIESYKMASIWAEVSPEPGSNDAADTSLSSIKFLLENPDSRIAKAMGWSNIIVRAVDEPTRQLAIAKIEEFGGQVTIKEEGVVEVLIPATDN